MWRVRTGLACLVITTGIAGCFSKAGLQRITDAPCPIAVWYPITEHNSERLNFIKDDLALDAPIAEGKHGLIIVTDGRDGDMFSHEDTALALAKAGFVVMERGYVDKSGASPACPWTGTNRISKSIDYALEQWTLHESIDPARIGLIGYGEGAFIALVTIGGDPDPTFYFDFCRRHSTYSACVALSNRPQSSWNHDPRVKSAVVAAPVLIAAFGGHGLRGVRVPVELWESEKDAVGKPDLDNGNLAWKAMPHFPKLYVALGSTNYDFLALCSDEQGKLETESCREKSGFSRKVFHDQFNEAVADFFTKTLK